MTEEKRKQAELAELNEWLASWQATPVHSEKEQQAFDAEFPKKFERQSQLQAEISKLLKAS